MLNKLTLTLSYIKKIADYFLEFRNYNLVYMKYISVLLLVFLTHLLDITIQRCIHDEVIKGKKMVPIDDTQIHISRRMLQNTLGYGPIRFHKQYDTNSISSKDAIGKNIIKIMDIVLQFWQEVIQVDYIPSLSFKIPSNFDPNKFKCLDFVVPPSLILNPTPNKDYGLLIQAKDDGDSGITAFSYPCAYSSTTNQPLWGLIHWNKQYMSFNPLNFQQNLHIGIHQMLHILGFSQLLYSSFANPNILVNHGSDLYLTGKYINQQVTRQYGCTNPKGMTVETGGGAGTARSHWSRKTALNQLMTAGVSVNNPTISYISLALLQQTGWYRKIYKNHGKFINFGFRKGCSMLDPRNCTSDQYCRVKDQKTPDYDKTSLGYCKNDSLTNCLYVKYYVNFICTDPNYAQKSLHADQGVIKVTSETGGMRSRCYVSDLRMSGADPSKYSFRCYETICSPSGKTLTIRVGKKFAFCLFPNQEVKVGGYDGTLLCPQSFKAMCAIQRCPNECNANGICLNGRCLCAPQYKGQACQQLSTSGFMSLKSIFLPIQNQNCMEGSFLNEFGQCQACPYRCSRCRNYKACIVCFGDVLPNLDGTCN